jgi:hypothetical protein
MIAYVRKRSPKTKSSKLISTFVKCDLESKIEKHHCLSLSRIIELMDIDISTQQSRFEKHRCMKVDFLKGV